MAIETIESENNMEEVEEKLSVVAISQILLHSWHVLTGFPVTVLLLWICFAV